MGFSHSTTIRHEWLITTLIVLFASIGAFASDSYLPSLPSMKQVFNSNTSTMQLSVTLFIAGTFCSQLIYGPYSDRLGRRKVMLFGLFIASLGSIFCSIANNALILILARFIQGFGVGVTSTLFRAIMRDRFTGIRMSQVASYAGIIFAVMPAMAPIIGGYIHILFGWRANFIFLTLLIMTVWFIAWRYLPETNKKLDPSATQAKIAIKNYVTLLTNRIFISHVGCASLAGSGIFAYITVSPFLFQTILGLTALQYAWLAVYITIGIILGQCLNALWVKKLGIKYTLFVGIVIMFVSGIIMLLIGVINYINVAVIILPTLFFIVGGCLVFANAMAGAFEPFPHIAGAAGAIYGSIQALVGFIVSLIMAAIPLTNQLPLASVFVLLSIVSAAIFYFYIK